jgi:transcriptional regulator
MRSSITKTNNKKMYKLPHYTETDKATIIEFINANPFAVVTGIGEQYPVASHLPLAIEEKEGRYLLHGHLMKKSDHHLAFENNNNVLVIFTGPHCYISASWYGTPQMASTWNYITVHAKGTIHFTDEAGTVAAVKAVTERFEGTGTAASFDKLGDAYVNAMVKAIVGFTIEVESLDAVFKLSQNRDEASKKSIIAQLKKAGDDNSVGIATEMEKRL